MLAIWPQAVEASPGMGLFRKFLTNRYFLSGIAGFGLLLIGAAIFAWKVGADFTAVKALIFTGEKFLQTYPLALFGALVFLPGLPIPTSALLVTAGMVWRHQPLMACVLSVLALSLNLVWTYWLAAGPARGLVDRLIQAADMVVPELPSGHHLKWILVLKLTPGIPLFFQNYLLGFLRAPFGQYFWVSVLCNGVVGSGMVLSGAGVAGSSLTPLLTGLSLMVLAVVLTRWIRSRGRS
jgi:uncharacterized membrane protein YdjX (TVP38/TMEM64 family)